jgi:enoyl-CoA hydratase/carnithine racemase
MSMPQESAPPDPAAPLALPELAHLHLEDRGGGIVLLRLDRPEKRNAINDGLIDSLGRFFGDPPAGARVAVIHGAGDHFSAGLDLSEHSARDPAAVMRHSRLWHGVFERVQFGGLPVVSALHGGVIGGGLELAVSTHVRVAEESCFYALPEGQRGIFVGGGASVRLARIVGADRMAEMMLTGRSYSAEDGQALGISHHLAAKGEGLATALELAGRIAENAPLSNFAIIQAVPRIADMAAGDGLFTEALVAALVQSDGEAERRMRDFLEKRADKVAR